MLIIVAKASTTAFRCTAQCEGQMRGPNVRDFTFMDANDLLTAMRQHYPCGEPRRQGMGNRPALLVVDFIEGFTRAESPLGGPWDEAIGHTSALLANARSCGVPIVFTTVEYSAADLSTNLLAQKSPGIRILLKDSRWTAIDHRLGVSEGDLVISKKYGSAFFGTSLASQLQVKGIDSLLISGCVTSGCVRASAIDAVQSGFRATVVRETVGDRSLLANEANLIDIEQRYGDVISIGQAIDYLQGLPRC